MKKAAAIILTLIMSSGWLAVFLWGIPDTAAITVLTFNGGEQSMTVVFPPGGGIIDNVSFRFPGGSNITSATLNVTGGPSVPGGNLYPQNLTVDILGDGRDDWVWGGAGNGAMGRQTVFANDCATVSDEFTAPGTHQTGLRLPSNAKVDKASFHISGGKKEYFNTSIINGVSGENLGYAVAAIGDVNGDGTGDYAMGTYAYYYAERTGHVYIFYGNASGTLPASADVKLNGEQIDDLFGASVAGAGDVNGDGYDDVLVGAYYYDGVTLNWPGIAYLYYGGKTMNTTPDLRFEGLIDNAQFGYSLDGIGDVNVDGYDDIIISANYNESGGYNRGAAYVYFGGAPMNNVSDISFLGVTDYDYYGSWVAGVGDLNNDTRPDFAIGADAVNTHGEVYVYFGGPGLDSVPDLNLTSTATDYFGEYLAGAGDLNGDGYDDLAVQAGLVEVWIYYGGKPMDATRDLKLLGEPEFHNTYGVSWFGWGIDGLGDIDSDGYGDLMVGALGYESSAATNNLGRAYIYLGGPAMDAIADYNFTGSEDHEMLGGSVAGIGDVNGDSSIEFLIGAYMDGTATGNGKVYIETFSKGLINPEVRILETGTLLWNHTGWFSGDTTTADLSSVLNNALGTLLPSFIDSYGTRFTNLTLNVSSKSRGDFCLNSLSVVYNLTIAVPGFSGVLNDFMAQHVPGPDGYYNVTVRLKSSSEGSVRVDGLRLVVDQAPEPVSQTAVCRLPEGSRNSTLLDLSTLFTDDFTPVANLTFTLGEVNDNYTHVELNLTQKRYLSADALTHNADPNWTGTTEIEVTASDALGLVSGAVLVTVEIYNVEDPPLITSQPSLTAMEGTPYSYDLNALDGDPADVLTYYIASGPAGMSMTPSTGLLNWTPGLGDISAHDIVVGVNDGHVNVTQNFTLTVAIHVTPGNHLPVVLSEPPITARVGATYSYKINASDSDWDQLAYTLVTAPTGMVLNRSSGEISWLPQASDVGFQNVSVNISDGKDRIFHTWTIRVAGDNPNHPPEIIGTPPSLLYAGTELNFQFNFTDADGDVPTFKLVSGPEGLQLDPSGRLIWTPSTSQVGAWTVTVGLTDGMVAISKTYSLDVYLNHAPTFNSTSPAFEVKVSKEYRYKVTVADIDPGDIPVLALIVRPDGMSLNNATGELVWIPSKDQVGSNFISLRATDGRSTTWQNYTITVPKPTTGGGTPTENQWLVPLLLMIIIAGVVGAVGYIAYRKSKKAAAERALVIDDIFLVYKDGRLMSHHTRRLKPETDGEILTSMLTAIQDFVKQSIPTEGELQKPVQEIAFGEAKILIQHGKNIYIAAVVAGPSHERFTHRMREKVDEIETRFGSHLDHWNGDISAIGDVKVIAKSLLSEGGEMPEASHAPPEGQPPAMPEPKKDDASSGEPSDDGDYEKVDINDIGKEPMEPKEVDEKPKDEKK